MDRKERNQLTKFCVRCQQERPLRKFNPRAASKDGYQSYCKRCSRKARRLHLRGKAGTAAATTLSKIMIEKGLTSIDSSCNEIFEELKNRTGYYIDIPFNSKIMQFIMRSKTGQKLFEWDGYKEYTKEAINNYRGGSLKRKVLKLKENNRNSFR